MQYPPLLGQLYQVAISLRSFPYLGSYLPGIIADSFIHPPNYSLEYEITVNKLAMVPKIQSIHALLFWGKLIFSFVLLLWFESQDPNAKQ